MKTKIAYGILIIFIGVNIYGNDLDDTILTNYQSIPLSITSSGAVSLGSYQAGYHYYEIEWLKLNKHLFDVKAVTGASAGAINALLTVLSLADTTCAIDTQSIFYQSWIPIGIDQLKGNRDPLGIVNRRRMDSIADKVIGGALERIQRESGQSLSELDLVLAVTVNRNKPVKEKLNKLTIPRSKDFFIVKVNKDMNDSIRFRNYYYDSLNISWNILPFGTYADKDILKGMVYASSAFPFAFSPYTALPVKLINLYAYQKSHQRILSMDTFDLWKNTSDHLISYPSFSDGGLFNNEPIRLAYQLSLHGLKKTSTRYRWKPTLSKDNSIASDSLLLIYLNPANKMYPAMHNGERADSKNLVNMLFNELPVIFETTRKNELFSLLEDNDTIGNQLLLTENYITQISGYLGNFFGFFDIDFRRFDFYVGMYDAERLFTNLSRTNHKYHHTFDHKSITYPSMQYELSENDNLLQKKWKKVDNELAERIGASAELVPSISPGHSSTTLYVRNEYLLIKTVFNNIFDLIDTLSLYQTTADIAIPDDNLLRACNPNFVIMLQTTVDRLWAYWYLEIARGNKCTFNDDDYSIEDYVKWNKLLAIHPYPPKILTYIKTTHYRSNFNEFVNDVSRNDNDYAIIKHLSFYGYKFEKQTFKRGFRSCIKTDIDNLAYQVVENASISDPANYLIWGYSIPRITNFYFYQPKIMNYEILYNASKGKGGWEAIVNCYWLRFGIIRFGNCDGVSDLRPEEFNITAGINVPITSGVQSPFKRQLHYNAFFQPSVAICGLIGINKNIHDITIYPHFGSFNQYGLCINPSFSLLDLFKAGISFQYRESNIKKITYDRHKIHIIYQAGCNLTNKDLEFTFKWLWNTTKSMFFKKGNNDHTT